MCRNKFLDKNTLNFYNWYIDIDRYILMPYKRHVGQRPGQDHHIGATSAKTIFKITEGHSLHQF